MEKDTGQDEGLTSWGLDEFFAERFPWFEVKAIDNDHGGWDVWLRLDGTYSSVLDSVVARELDVDHFVRWISRIAMSEQVSEGVRSDAHPSFVQQMKGAWARYLQDLEEAGYGSDEEARFASAVVSGGGPDRPRPSK